MPRMPPPPTAVGREGDVGVSQPRGRRGQLTLVACLHSQNCVKTHFPSQPSRGPALLRVAGSAPPATCLVLT